MKIRNGFVSNSSSASFILIAKTETPNSKNYGKTFVRESSRNRTVHNDYEDIYVPPFDGEVSYCRGDVMRIDTIEDKIRYVMAIYAFDNQYDKDYFEKALSLRDKIISLGHKRWYSISLEIPPLSAYWSWDYDWSNKDNPRIPGSRKLVTFVNVSTECHYSSGISKMCEDEDTTRLDSFLFNPQSFGILGGDEYDETYKLRKECIPELTYDYDMISDYSDHKAGDVMYVDREGVTHYWEWDYDWKTEALNYNDDNERGW